MDERVTLTEEQVSAQLDELCRRLAHAESERDELRCLFDQAPAFIAMVSTPDHIYTFSNAPNNALIGHEVVGKSLREVLPEPDASRLTEAIDRIQLSGEPVIALEFPTRLGRGAGEEFYVSGVLQPLRSPDGQVRGVLSLAVDVSEQVKARRELEEARARFDALASATGQLLWTLDATGRVVTGYPTWQDYTGQSREGMRGRGWLKAVHPDDRDRLIADWERASREACPFESAYRLRRHDGAYRHFTVRGVPRRAPDGRIVEWVGTSTDIDDLKRAEQEIVRQQAALLANNERLKELDRLKTSFINAASHELRTPLVSIMGYAEFLEDGLGGALTSLQADFVRAVQSSAGRLSQLVDDLLDFAQLEARTFRLVILSFDLLALLRDAVERLQAEADAKQIQVALQLPPGEFRVDGDPRRIGQVIGNLLDNAIKFTPTGGRVHMVACARPHGVRVELQDSGIGIAHGHLAQLFQKFYQVDPSLTREYGGSGIGLAIGKALIEAHGGAIGVESALGHGSTFWFELPWQAMPADDGLGFPQSEPKRS